jgi:hypothetical protein
MAMVTLEELMDQWERDTKVDSTEPGKEILRVPILHNKYLKILSQHNLALKKAQMDLSKMRKTKWMYYNGKLTQEELQQYGWEPFPFTLKADLGTYMDADDDLQRLKAKTYIHEECVAFATSVLKELNNRTWQLRSFMDWEKFIMGQN